ncbi:MAG: hypothetical protein ACRDHE_01610, partial [Ktedonobacterales bacterium]
MDARPATPAAPSRDTRPPCFLCAYSDTPCDVDRSDGLLLRVRERDARSGCPTLTLAGDDGATVEIQMHPEHRSVVQPLAALTDDALRTVRVRVWHLLRISAGNDGGQRLKATPVSVLVVEPDLLLNITDINNAEYCVRQYPLRRMVPSPPNAATLRGSIIHSAFKELLKGGGATTRGDELRRALNSYSSDLALRQLSPDEVAADAEPHMAALWSWYDTQNTALWGRVGS